MNKYMYLTQFLIIFTLTIYLAINLKTPNIAAQQPDPSTDFQSESGIIRGFIQNINGQRLRTYYGIPYAQPPTNHLRFKPPQRLQLKWIEPYNATKLSYGCPQPGVFVTLQQYAGTGFIDYSEDCLYLNIWAPETRASESLLPVLVFVHGGALLFNSASELKYFDGKGLAAITKSIVVTLNYRLGVFGFLYGNSIQYPGNVGLMDQKEAFDWVRRNINQLNGDHSRITVFGESAGSWSVGLHLLSNYSRGSFDVAVMMSGSPLNPLVTEPSNQSWVKTKLLASQFNCNQSTTSSIVQCLQQVSWVELVDAQMNSQLLNVQPNAYRLPFQPVYGGKSNFLTRSPIELLIDSNEGSRKVPLMIGTLTNEGQDVWGLWRQTYQFNQTINPISTLNYKNGTRMYLQQLFPSIDPQSLDNIINYYYSDSSSHMDKYNYEFSDPIDLRNIRNSTLGPKRKVNAQIDTEHILYQLLGDIVFVCPSQYFARLWYNHANSNVYMYTITYRTTSVGGKNFTPWCKQTQHGPCHMADLQYVFGMPFINHSIYSRKDREMSALLMSELISMSQHSAASWPPYHTIHGPRGKMILPVEAQLNPVSGSRLVSNYRSFECSLWNDYMFDSMLTSHSQV